MLIVSFKNIGEKDLVEKYSDKVCLLEFNSNELTNSSLIEFIEQIKQHLVQFEIVIIYYINEVILCLDTLAIQYTIAYPSELDKLRIEPFLQEYDIFKVLATTHDNIVLVENETLENKLGDTFNWLCSNTTYDLNIVEPDNTMLEETPPAIDKKDLTLQELIEHDLDITESDIRDLKSTTNKFKVAMILQAKTRLNMVLKLCDTLDKLYAELVDRIDVSLKTTDTSSLMYTADYISKALSETNQFIMSLITNEKIQNFFIIDNSSIINITDNRVDIDRREKIRKAAEIVLDNADYFTTGQYDKVINPNSVFENNEEGNDENANTTT